MHVKSVKCDFCSYPVAPRCRKRLYLHIMRKHDFPTKPSLCLDFPDINPVQPAIEPASLPVNDLTSPETDLIRLDAQPASFDSMDVIPRKQTL